MISRCWFLRTPSWIGRQGSAIVNTARPFSSFYYHFSVPYPNGCDIEDEPKNAVQWISALGSVCRAFIDSSKHKEVFAKARRRLESLNPSDFTFDEVSVVLYFHTAQHFKVSSQHPAITKCVEWTLSNATEFEMTSLVLILRSWCLAGLTDEIALLVPYLVTNISRLTMNEWLHVLESLEHIQIRHEELAHAIAQQLVTRTDSLPSHYVVTFVRLMKHHKVSRQTNVYASLERRIVAGLYGYNATQLSHVAGFFRLVHHEPLDLAREVILVCNGGGTSPCPWSPEDAVHLKAIYATTRKKVALDANAKNRRTRHLLTHAVHDKYEPIEYDTLMSVVDQLPLVSSTTLLRVLSSRDLQKSDRLTAAIQGVLKRLGTLISDPKEDCDVVSLWRFVHFLDFAEHTSTCDVAILDGMYSRLSGPNGLLHKGGTKVVDVAKLFESLVACRNSVRRSAVKGKTSPLLTAFDKLVSLTFDHLMALSKHTTEPYTAVQIVHASQGHENSVALISAYMAHVTSAVDKLSQKEICDIVESMSLASLRYDDCFRKLGDRLLRLHRPTSKMYRLDDFYVITYHFTRLRFRHDELLRVGYNSMRYALEVDRRVPNRVLAMMMYTFAVYGMKSHEHFMSIANRILMKKAEASAFVISTVLYSLAKVDLNVPRIVAELLPCVRSTLQSATFEDLNQTLFAVRHFHATGNTHLLDAICFRAIELLGDDVTVSDVSDFCSMIHSVTDYEMDRSGAESIATFFQANAHKCSDEQVVNIVQYLVSPTPSSKGPMCSAASKAAVLELMFERTASMSRPDLMASSLFLLTARSTFAPKKLSSLMQRIGRTADKLTPASTRHVLVALRQLNHKTAPLPQVWTTFQHHHVAGQIEIDAEMKAIMKWLGKKTV
eukprot:PhM_4_TR17367/c0_g1_i1/m.35656